MFQDRLKIAAVRYFGSLKNLSEASNINYNQLSGYANGRKQPGLSTLNSLAEAGINIDWLITGEGEIMRNVAYDSEIMEQIESFQNEMTELNSKIDVFLRTKYAVNPTV